MKKRRVNATVKERPSTVIRFFDAKLGDLELARNRPIFKTYGAQMRSDEKIMVAARSADKRVAYARIGILLYRVRKFDVQYCAGIVP